MCGTLTGAARHLELLYSLNESTVLINAAKIACTFGRESPGFFCQMWELHMRTPKVIENLPSWCPDFSNRREEDRLVPVAMSDDKISYSGIAWNELVEYESIVFEHNSNTMSITGLPLSAIMLSSTTAMEAHHFVFPFGNNALLSEEERYVERLAALRSVEIWKWMSEMDELFLSDDSDKFEASKTWLQKIFFSEVSSPYEQLRTRFKDLLSFHVQMQKKGTRTWLEAACKLKAPLDQLHQVLEDMSKTSRQRGRYFFITTSGKVGYSPVKTRPGDKICYIPGGDNLSVLSPNFDRYVTCASVIGWMGDVLPMLITSTRLWEDNRQVFHLQ